MHTGNFTFKGTSTGTGELLIDTPEKLSPQNNRHGDLRSGRIIAEAIKETLKYEKGATRKIASGVILNYPWVVMLFYVGGGLLCTTHLNMCSRVLIPGETMTSSSTKFTTCSITRN